MQVGDIIPFGAYEWRVLDIRDGAALLITEDIAELRAYHDDPKDTTWAACELRRYLNSTFYGRFSEGDRAKIITVTNKNPANPWYGQTGGEDTEDKVFLLTVEDVVCRYFGDSSANLYNRGKNQRYWFQRKDVNNARRKAAFEEYGWWWWLRTPGRTNWKAVYIHGNGNIGIQGNSTFRCNISTLHVNGDNRGGVRPALWMKL